MERTKIIPMSEGSAAADKFARDIKERGYILIVNHQLSNGDYEIKWYDAT